MKCGIKILLKRRYLSVNGAFHLLEIVDVAGHCDRPSVFVTEFHLRFCQKSGNELMPQIKYRNHKPLPLFSHVDRHATLRNQLPAAAIIERRRVPGSRSEGPSEAEKGVS